MIGLPGAELSLDPDLSPSERLYVRLLGAPINGLRIRLRRVLPATAGDHRRILDAGCGPGVFTMELAKRHPEAEVLGVDLDPEAVARASVVARRAGLANCRFEVADVTRLDFREPFDLIVSVDNLEHVEEDVVAMRALRNALSSTGRLVVHVPGYYRRWLAFRRRVNFHVPGHVRAGYTAEDLASKLSRAGLQVLDCHYTYGLLETFTNNVSYVITGAQRRNRGLYAFVFPFLLALSYFGQFGRPRWGAGVLAIARRAGLSGGSTHGEREEERERDRVAPQEAREGAGTS